MTASATLPLPPVAVPEALPELVTASCGYCEEGGVLRDAGTAWEHWTDCEMCGGSGHTEVCPRCKQVPGVQNGLEVCGCTEPLCEACETKTAEIDSICGSCFADALTRCNELSPKALELEYDFARENGWIG